MNAYRSLFLGTAVTAGIALAAVPSFAQDCDAMMGEIDQLLPTADLTDEQKQQVLNLRDQGMGETTRAGGDCTDTLQQALDILKGEAG